MASYSIGAPLRALLTFLASDSAAGEKPRQGAAETAALFSDVEADIEGIDIGIDLADAASKGAR